MVIVIVVAKLSNCSWSRPLRHARSERAVPSPPAVSQHVVERTDVNTRVHLCLSARFAAIGTVHGERFADNDSFIDVRRGSKLSIHSQLTGYWLTLTATLTANASQPTPASQPIDRAPHSTRAPRRDVCIHHRRADIRVAQELLHGPDIVPGLAQIHA